METPTSAKYLLVLFFACLLSVPATGQGKKQLEEKRKQLLREIELTSEMLTKTKKTRESTYHTFLTLQKQIQRRNQLIKTLQAEIVLTNETIDQDEQIVEALREDLVLLRANYAELARSAYRQKVNQSELFFIFSASGFNDAYRRWQYLRQYQEYRKKQAVLLLHTEEELSRRIKRMEEQLQEKENLLISSKQQAEIIAVEMETKNEMLLTLRQDEAKLDQELKTKQDAHEELNLAIERIIREEIARSRERARSPEVSEASKTAEANLEEGLTSTFNRSKGKLLMPVKKGVVIRPFGRQAHPTNPEVSINNNGIDIQTDVQAEVRAVFQGQVVSVNYIHGLSNTVILRHGDFYTVYANLETVGVRRGDLVPVQGVLGQVSTDPITNIAFLHFEVWRDKARLNPTTWLKP